MKIIFIILLVCTILSSCSKENNSSINSEAEWKSLMDAVDQDNPDIVKWILQKTSFKNNPYNLEDCPKQAICGPINIALLIKKNKKIVRMLIEAGINPNTQNWSTGDTPLISAVILKDYAIADLLIKNGADPNLQNNFWISPILGSIFEWDVEMTKILLQNNPDISQKLISSQISPYLKSLWLEEWMTLLDVSKKFNHNKITVFLREKWLRELE